ncbi:hypothetical protein [Sphaerisporangium sp. TRM90804]|uniref:hypothetical protein n=1 Tax=Sphaerisporangium sp. TRM90804 TaxID=3031113 RepID=UPI002447B904|nr:hypothetical protein [Sphaerisporangium sp. TRM90804]MDH2424805.1 hypothetical protein [Sphaerisporangium sp. TRM90804]
MTAVSEAPSKPCGCRAACDHLPYQRLARGAQELGRRLDEMAEVMRDAITAAHESGPAAGMDRLLRYVREIPEMRDGLDLPGGKGPGETP